MCLTDYLLASVISIVIIKQVVKVIWHKTASPLQTDGSIVFARWRQCALMWAHWSHLANTVELVLLLAHPSPQPKRQINWFKRFCTARGRVSKGTLAPPGEYDWTHASFSTPKSTTQMANRSVQLFLHISHQIFYNWPPFPPNCPFPWGNLNRHLTHDSLGPSESSAQTASGSVQPFLQGLTSVTDRPTDWLTDRPTDHTTQSETTDRIYVCSTGDAV